MEKSAQEQEGKGFGLKLTKPTLAFVICLVISFVLWTIVKLSREYTVTYEYTVSCVEVPAGRALSQVSDNTLSLTFRARGFNLLNPRFRQKNRHIDLSISKLYYHKGAIETASFTQNELKDYLRENADLGSDFVGVTSPGALTVYLK